MRVEELRIGNWIESDRWQIVRICGFAPFCNSTRCDEQEGCMALFHESINGELYPVTYECEVENCTPIPLTEEILLKCGFETESKYDDFKLNGVNIQSCSMRCKTLERFSFYLKLGDENDELNNKIDYLHELQNLYYALTKKELDIKL